MFKDWNYENLEPDTKDIFQLIIFILFIIIEIIICLH